MAFGIMFGILGVLLVALSTAQTTTNSVCQTNKADVVFVLDSSSSEGTTNFNKQKTFVSNFIKQFDVGPDKFQFSVTTFSTDAHNIFWLNQHRTKTSVLSAVSTVPYRTGSTHTDKALKLVTQQSFLPQHGGRKDVPHIVIVLTDGQSSSRTNTVLEANHLHSSGAKVFAVGIGTSIRESELQTIATDIKHVIKVSNFDALHTIQLELKQATCAVTECQTEADIVFLLDSSGSEGRGNFQTQLEFVKNFTTNFDIGPSKIQVSVATFGSTTRNQFWLNTYTNKAEVLKAISNTTFSGGTTHTAEALQFVRENNFDSNHGSRQSVPKILIVMTDGKSANSAQTVQEAARLHSAKVKVISIGIGTSVDKAELTSIATDTQHVFTVDGFDALHTILNELRKSACQKPTSACSLKETDIVFVLDSSSSEGPDNFKKQLEFVSNVVRQFKIGIHDVQVGLLTFSTSAHIQFYLNSYHDKTSLLHRITTTSYTQGSTYTDKALQYTRLFEFGTRHGTRPGASKIAVVLTDGHSSDRTHTIQQAQQLHHMGVEVIAVGIGTSTDKYELNAIASGRKHVFTVGSFDILHTLQTELIDATCGGVTPKPTVSPQCGVKPVDIVFVLDASGSEGSTNFRKQLDLAKNFVGQFQIGPKNVQVSVLTFSSFVHNQFYLNRYHDHQSLIDAVSHVPYQSGGTSTDKALKYVKEQSLQTVHGARPNVAKVVVVMTDGHSSNAAATRTEALALKRLPGVKVIAIGIGNVNHLEIETIATDSTHAFTVANFNLLQSLKTELTLTACQTCGFAEKADIAFVLDSSGSEGKTNFAKQLAFVTRFVNGLPVGPNNVQFSVVTFSDTAHLQFYLNTYTSKAALIAAIQRIPYSSGSTHTYDALKTVRERVFTGHGTRTDAKKYAIVLTDGASGNKNMTVGEATLLKQHKVTIMAVGIGTVNKDELNGIATDSRHVFTVNNFDALSSLQAEVKLAACGGTQTGTTGPNISTVTKPHISTPTTLKTTTDGNQIILETEAPEVHVVPAGKR